MIQTEKSYPKGRYTVYYTDIKTGRKWQETFDNVVTRGFWGEVFKRMDYSVSLPVAASLNVTHLAVGTGTTAPTQADTAMQTEIFRKGYSYRSFTPTKFTVETSLAASEGNPTGDYIKELGIFVNATDTPGSGILISRAASNIFKNSGTSIIIVWELTY